MLRLASLTLLAAVGALLVAGCASSQSAMSPEIEKRLREIGRVSAPLETRPLYAPLQPGEPHVSAFYDLQRLQATETFRQYHGTDPARYAERSPLPGLLRSRVPMLFAVAEYDTPDFNEQAEIMKEAFCRAGACPRLLVLPKHSHMSEIYSVNTADRGLTDEVLRFVRSQR